MKTGTSFCRNPLPLTFFAGHAPDFEAIFLCCVMLSKLIFYSFCSRSLLNVGAVAYLVGGGDVALSHSPPLGFAF